MRTMLAALALLPLIGCAGKGSVAGAAPPNWRTIASGADRERIRSWRDTWEQALVKATPRHAAEIAAAGATLQPDAALADPAPPTGDFSCRIFKLGGKTPANPDFSVTPARTCRVAINDEQQLRFSILEGPQRPNGGFFADGQQRRLIYLGSMILSDEKKSMRYGTDTERNIAGFVERIGPRTWRVALPAPRWETMFEVIELTPAG